MSLTALPRRTLLASAAAAMLPAAAARAGEVPLSIVFGAFRLNATLNRTVNLVMTLDTGAADVSLPASAVTALRNNGTLTDADYRPTRMQLLADGRRQAVRPFVLHSLVVGDRMVENVLASSLGGEGLALLGQSFLGRFRTWSVDNARSVLILP